MLWPLILSTDVSMQNWKAFVRGVLDEKQANRTTKSRKLHVFYFIFFDNKNRLTTACRKKGLQIFNLCWKVLQKTRECSHVPSIMFSCCSVEISNSYHIRTVKKCAITFYANLNIRI